MFVGQLPLVACGASGADSILLNGPGWVSQCPALGPPGNATTTSGILETVLHSIWGP